MKTLALFGLALSTLQLQAQDLIIFRNGSLQDAKVLEVRTDEVIYKKSDNLDGPNYVAGKTEISVIEYANGSKDVMPYVNNDEAPSAPSRNYSQAQSIPPPEVRYNQPRVNVVLAPVSPYFYGGFGCVGTYRPSVSRHVNRNVYVRSNYGRRCRW